MKHDGNGHARGSRSKLWAGLTLATIVAASGAVTIANADMRSEHIRPPRSRTFTCSGGFACLQGKSTGTSTHGVYASSTEANAIQAVTTSTTSNSAVAGYAVAASGTGIGVYGTSSNGPGLYGSSTGPGGVSANSYGVYGTSTNSNGVYGYTSNFNSAIAGFNDFTGSDDTNAVGVYGTSTAGIGVEGWGTSYGVLSHGNAYVVGEIYTAGSCHSGCTKRRQQASFGARTSQPTIEDVGEAALHNGVARVALASDFANVIDSNKPYVVLLTPEGDSPLYVASRNATGFEVREIGGGHSSISFAYRIVAKPYGVKDERLPFKTTSDPNREHR